LAGWRARLGIMVPSVNKTMEPELYRLTPEGVSLHFSRIRQVEDTLEQLGRMIEDVPRAAIELADAGVDVIAFGCTTGSLVKGHGYDREIIEKIEGNVHIKATTTATAVVEALKELGIVRLSVATPYKEWLNEKEKEFLEAHGFEVISIKGLGCLGPETADVPSERVYRLAKDVYRPRADGVFISCTDLQSIDILEYLEHDIKKPVISSNQATMWIMLRMAEVRDKIVGYGRLLTQL